MIWLFLIFTVLSAIVLLIGCVWTLVLYGRTRRRSGPEVGAEVMAGSMRDGLAGKPVVQYTAFKGKAVAVEREASFSFADIKTMVRQGQWGRVLPVLMAIAGMWGLLFFGSISLLLGTGDLLIGGLAVVVAFYSIIRMFFGFVRA